MCGSTANSRSAGPAWTPAVSALWSEDLDTGEIGPIAGGIAGEQHQTPDGSVGADVEIGQRRGPCASPAAVSQEALSGKETGCPWHRFALVHSSGKNRVQIRRVE